jgi:hypothetical protein
MDAVIVKGKEGWRIVLPEKGERIKFLQGNELDDAKKLEAAHDCLNLRLAARFSAVPENRVKVKDVDWGEGRNERQISLLSASKESRVGQMNVDRSGMVDGFRTEVNKEESQNKSQEKGMKPGS